MVFRDRVIKDSFVNLVLRRQCGILCCSLLFVLILQDSKLCHCPHYPFFYPCIDENMRIVMTENFTLIILELSLILQTRYEFITIGAR